MKLGSYQPTVVALAGEKARPQHRGVTALYQSTHTKLLPRELGLRPCTEVLTGS